MQGKDKVEQSFMGNSVAEIAIKLHSDYHQLDRVIIEKLTYNKLIGWNIFNGAKMFPELQLVDLPRIFNIFNFFPLLPDLLKALRFLGSADERSCLLVNGGTRLGIIACVLNSFLSGNKRKIVLFDAFIPDNRSWGVKYNIIANKIRKYVACRMILGTSLTVVWSSRQIEIQSKFLGVPKSKFVSIPWTSNHSKSPPITLQIGNYVFSGGNSRRDYQTLFEAVRGTGVPVLVSTTDSRVYAHLDIPENVVLLAANEPAFARLMAASRFVVVPILPELLRGAGETTVCDAMWHGRAVICADNISAFEYVEEGITGYVTSPGDVASLRKRILELWNQPDKASQMGLAAHQSIEADNTNEHCMCRLRALGALVAAAI